MYPLRILILLTSLLAVTPLSAQVDEPAETRPAMEEASRFIQAGDIPLAAEQAIGEMEYQAARLAQGMGTDQLNSQLDELETRLGQITGNEWAVNPGELSVRARSLYKQRLMIIQSDRDAWTRQLDTEIAGLQQDRGRLRELQSRWKNTLEAYPGDELAPALRERSTRLLELAEQNDHGLKSELARLSGLYQRGRSVEIKVGDLLDNYAQAERQAISRVFTRDSVPIWQVFDADPGVAGAVSSGRRGPGSQRSLSAMLESYRNVLFVHGGLFAALLVLTLHLSRRRRTWAERPYLASAVKLFSTPVSMAMLLTLLCSVAVYYTLPLRAQDARSLLIVLLTLRVLHDVLSGGIRKMLYMSLGLFAATRLLEFAPEYSLVERFGLLAVNLAAAWFMYYVSRSLPVGQGASRWWAWGRLVATAAQPLLAVGVIGNLIGNVAFASLITLGSVFSMAAGVVLASGVLVLETTLTAVLHLEIADRVRVLRNHKELFRSRAGGVLRWVAFFAWIKNTLAVFEIETWAWDGLVSTVTYRIQLGSLNLSALDVIAFVTALYVSVLVSRFVRFMLEEEVYQRVQMPRGLPNTVSMLVNYGILALGFFVAISIAGIDLSRFAIIAGALGVGIGFGLQNVVNNFVSGLILAFERPIQVGDTIEVGQLIGHVLRIGFRSSTVRTYDGAEVIVPNGNLISAEVVNWTLSDRTRRIDIPVGVAYGTDPQRVLDILHETARAHKDVRRDPEPSAIFRGFGESSLDFSVRVWINDFEELYKVASDVSVNICAALAKAGIEIPFPQRDLHLRSVAPGISLSGSPGASSGNTGKDPGQDG